MKHFFSLAVALILLAGPLHPIHAANAPTTARGEQSSVSATPPGTTAAITSTPETQLLFAVEFRTGPRWDPAKPPHEQQHFKAHSANLKRLRDDGRILLGARYSDKGFILVRASSLSEARSLFEVDPSVQNQIFVFEVSLFSVFYPGCVTVPGKGAA